MWVWLGRCVCVCVCVCVWVCVCVCVCTHVRGEVDVRKPRTTWAIFSHNKDEPKHNPLAIKTTNMNGRVCEYAGVEQNTSLAGWIKAELKQIFFCWALTDWKIDRGIGLHTSPHFPFPTSSARSQLHNSPPWLFKHREGAVNYVCLWETGPSAGPIVSLFSLSLVVAQYLGNADSLRSLSLSPSLSF